MIYDNENLQEKTIYKKLIIKVFIYIFLFIFVLNVNILNKI